MLSAVFFIVFEYFAVGKSEESLAAVFCCHDDLFHVST